MTSSEETKPGSERRKHERAGIKLEAVLRGATLSEDITLEMINFSVGGFYCKTSRPLELMTKLGIQFQFPAYSGVPETSVEAVAVIVRAEAKNDDDGLYRMAACFIDMDRSSRDHIEDYVEWYHSRQTEDGRQTA